MEKSINNHDLQTNVQNAINFKSLLNAATIVVSANDGIITLTGTVDSYARKWRAEDAARNIVGVKEVVGAIDVKPGKRRR